MFLPICLRMKVSGFFVGKEADKTGVTTLFPAVSGLFPEITVKTWSLEP